MLVCNSWYKSKEWQLTSAIKNAPFGHSTRNTLLAFVAGVRVTKKMVFNFRYLCLISFMLFVSACSQEIVYSSCSSSVKEGHVWISITKNNDVMLGSERYSDDLLQDIVSNLSKSCETVTVNISSDAGASHKSVYETIKRIKVLGYKVASQ